MKIDIALLQEVQPPKLVQRETLVFREVHRGWGTAIYSRRWALHEIPLCREYPGRVVGASVSPRNGQSVFLASIHAHSDRVFPRLANMMDGIMEMYNGRTAIVGGDLNSARLAEKIWPGSGHAPFFEHMEAGPMEDCCQRMHGKELQTFFREGQVHPLQDDHLFVSRDLVNSLERCDVIDNDVTRRLSDHIPLLIELAV